MFLCRGGMGWDEGMRGLGMREWDGMGNGDCVGDWGLR